MVYAQSGYEIKINSVYAQSGQYHTIFYWLKHVIKAHVSNIYNRNQRGLKCQTSVV